MSRGDSFLSRWSRRKRRSREPAIRERTPQAAQPPPALPPPDALQFESDFAAFMQAQVEETVRRAALKKLFGDPRFNVMDGLDIYIDDYSREDPIPQAMLAQLEHAKDTLFSAQAPEAPPAAESEEAAAEATEEKEDSENA